MKRYYTLTAVFLLSLVFFSQNSLAQITPYKYVEEDSTQNVVEKKEKKVNEDLQEEPKPTFRDKTFFGGGLGFSFGTITSIEVSPMGGYRITPNWLAGIGFTYIYYADKRFNPTFTSHVYGGKLFSRYMIPVTNSLSLFPQLEYEYLSYQNSVSDGRLDNQGLFGGAGIFQGFGNGRSGVNIMFLYNFNHSETSGFYDSPWVWRFEFVF